MQYGEQLQKPQLSHFKHKE